MLSPVICNIGSHFWKYCSPLLMALVIDNGVETGDMNYVMKMGLHNAGSCHALPGCRYPVGRICGESVHGIWYEI